MYYLPLFCKESFFFSWKVFKQLDSEEHVNQTLIGLGRGPRACTFYIPQENNQIWVLLL